MKEEVQQAILTRTSVGERIMIGVMIAASITLAGGLLMGMFLSYITVQKKAAPPEPVKTISSMKAELDGMDRYENDSFISYYKQRMIGEAVVEKDLLVYVFEKKTERLVESVVPQRDDVPDALPNGLITRQEAENTVCAVEKCDRIDDTKLMYISPESNVLPLQPFPENPCWVVKSVNTDFDPSGIGGMLTITAVDALTGKILGNGVPPPYTGFSMSGPIYDSPCEDQWYDWIENARSRLAQMGYSVDRYTWPPHDRIQMHVSSDETAVFYEIAHGGTGGFANRCDPATGNYEYTFASDVESWITDYNKMPFTFIGSCGGMCYTGENTLSDAFRKGSNEDTATVGYCNMAEPQCDDCWDSSVTWQDRFFWKIIQGYTVKGAFDNANAYVPTCGSNSCMRFAGDQSFDIYPVVSRCGAAPSCSGGQTLAHRLGAAWDGYSIESNVCDDSCCPNNNDYCVMDGQCYWGSEPDENGWEALPHNIEYGTNKFLICSTQGLSEPAAWANPDYTWYWCHDESAGLAWNVGNGDADVEHEYAPTAGDGDPYYCEEYIAGNPEASRSTNCCCGDDSGEFYSVSPTDGTTACCDSLHECVLNGVCQNTAIQKEICFDGIDNDCDGDIDCGDADCSGTGAQEMCYNGGDDNCNGLQDCSDPACVDKAGPFRESSGSGYLQLTYPLNVNLTAYVLDGIGEPCESEYQVVPQDDYYFDTGWVTDNNFITFEMNWTGIQLDYLVEGYNEYGSGPNFHYMWEEIDSGSLSDGEPMGGGWSLFRAEPTQRGKYIRVSVRSHDPVCGTASIRNIARWYKTSGSDTFRCGHETECTGIPLCYEATGGYCSSQGRPCAGGHCGRYAVCEEMCSDGTRFDRCNDQDYYCSEGQLIYQCGLCDVGCPSGYSCENGECCHKVNGTPECIPAQHDTPAAL